MGHVKAEWRVTAFMRADRDAVDENLSKVIHGAELHDHVARITELRRLELGAVPGHSHVVAQIIIEHVPGHAYAGATPALGSLKVAEFQRAGGIGEQAPAMQKFKAGRIISMSVREDGFHGHFYFDGSGSEWVHENTLINENFLRNPF